MSLDLKIHLFLYISKFSSCESLFKLFIPHYEYESEIKLKPQSVLYLKFMYLVYLTSAV